MLSVVCTWLQTNFDCLHMLDLGETQHLMRATIYHIHKYLSEMNQAAGQIVCDPKAVVTVIHELADRLRLVQVTAPQLAITEFICQEPIRVFQHMLQAQKKKYKPLLKAHEYRKLAYAMPVALSGLLTNVHAEARSTWCKPQKMPRDLSRHIAKCPVDDIVGVWFEYCRLINMVVQSVMSHDEACAMYRQTVLLQEMKLKYMPGQCGHVRGWCYPKHHALNTLASSRIMYGAMGNASTEMSERSHTETSVQPHMLTNNKDNIPEQKFGRFVRADCVRQVTAAGAVSSDDESDVTHDSDNSEAGAESDSLHSHDADAQPLVGVTESDSPNKGRGVSDSIPISRFPIHEARMYPARVRVELRSQTRALGQKIKHVSLAAFSGGPNSLFAKHHPAFAELPRVLANYILHRYWREIRLPPANQVRMVRCSTVLATHPVCLCM